MPINRGDLKQSTRSIECFSQINMQMLTEFNGFSNEKSCKNCLCLEFNEEEKKSLLKRGMVVSINSLIDDKNLFKIITTNVKYYDSVANLASKTAVFPLF